MRKIKLLIATIFGFTSFCMAADTTTTRMGLTKPAQSSANWGVKVNTNYDILDSSVALLSGSNIFTGTNTFVTAPAFSTMTIYQLILATPTYSGSEPLVVKGTGKFFGPNGAVVSLCDANGLNCTNLATQNGSPGNGVVVTTMTVSNLGVSTATVSVLNASSGTFSSYLTVAGMAGGQCVQTSANGKLITSGAGCGGGGVSSLAISTGNASFSSVISSPTRIIDYDSSTFRVSLIGAATAFVQLTNVGLLNSTQTWTGNNTFTKNITASQGITASSVTAGIGLFTSSITTSGSVLAGSNGYGFADGSGLTEPGIGNVQLLGAAGVTLDGNLYPVAIKGGTYIQGAPGASVADNLRYSLKIGTQPMSTLEMNSDDFHVGVSTLGYLVLRTVASGTQCLQADSSGKVTGSGSACGTGSGGGGDNFGSHIATRTVTANYGIVTTSVTVSSITASGRTTLNGSVLVSSSLVVNLVQAATGGSPTAIIGYWQGPISGPGTEPIGIGGYVYSTGTLSDPGATADGSFGLATDDPESSVQLIGARGRAWGKGTAPQYAGGVFQGNWQSDKVGGTTSTIVGVEADVWVTAADGTTPKSTGTVISLLIPAPLYGSGATNQTWATYSSNSYPSYYAGNIGIGNTTPSYGLDETKSGIRTTYGITAATGAFSSNVSVTGLSTLGIVNSQNITMTSATVSSSGNPLIALVRNSGAGGTAKITSYENIVGLQERGSLRFNESSTGDVAIYTSASHRAMFANNFNTSVDVDDPLRATSSLTITGLTSGTTAQFSSMTATNISAQAITTTGGSPGRVYLSEGAESVFSGSEGVPANYVGMWADSTSHNLKASVAASTGTVMLSTMTTVSGMCVQSTGDGKFITTNGACGTGTGGGGGSGTVIASTQYQVPYYSGTGSSTTLTGATNLQNNGSTITLSGLSTIVEAGVSTVSLQNVYFEQTNIINPIFTGQPKGAYFQSTSTGNPNGAAVPSGFWGQLNYNTTGTVTTAHGLGIFGRVWMSSTTQGFGGGVEGNCHSSSTFTTAGCIGVIGHASFNSDGSGTSAQIQALHALAESYQADETTPRSTGTVMGLSIDASVGGALKYGVYQTGPSDENIYFGKTIGVPLNAQPISEGTVIKDDSCGTAKLITSTAAVTTNSTSTFVATSISIDSTTQALNAGCRMDVCNTGAFTITLKANAGIFYTYGLGDVKLYSGACMNVTGTGSYWLQTSPASIPTNLYVSTGPVKNGNYTMGSTDSVIFASAPVLGSTITLPAATNAGQIVIINKVDFSTYPVTILATGGNTLFDTSITSMRLLSNAQSQVFVADGINRWNTVGHIAATPPYLGDNIDTTLAAAVAASSAAYILPLKIYEPTVITGVRFVVGAQNGNMDVGLYTLNNNTLTRVASSGSTAVPASGAASINFTGPINVNPVNGPYFLAIAVSNVTATFNYRTANGFRCRGYTTSFPLPASLTYSGFALDNTVSFALVGLVSGGI